MQIVIDIPKEVYEDINKHAGMAYAVEDYLYEVEWAIKDGTPLPEKHGKLIDYSWVVDNVIKRLEIKDKRYLLEAEKALMSIVESAPTIIEADKGSEDKE